MLTSHHADSRRSQSQCLSDTYAGFRNEAINIELESSTTSTSHNQPCAISIRLAPVARAGTTSAAQLSAFVIRRQSGADGLLNGTASEHGELLDFNSWAKELCAGRKHTRESATTAGEHAAAKQRVQLQQTRLIWLWTSRPPVLLRNCSTSKWRISGPAKVESYATYDC